MKLLKFRDLLRMGRKMKRWGYSKWVRYIYLDGMTGANKLLKERNKEG